MDSTSSLTSDRRGGTPECGRPDLALRLSAGEELSGPLGDELAAHSKTCPSCSMRLSLIQQAERWLADQASSNRSSPVIPTPCPSAEDLYDFGRGPGAVGIQKGAEQRIEAHLVDCADCRGLVATLAARPPAPWLDAGRELSTSAMEREVQASPRPRPSALPAVQRPAPQRRWLSYAAAAAVLAGAFYLWSERRTSSGADRKSEEFASVGIVYPKAPLLRGDLASSLLAPGALVLASLSSTETGTWHPIRFELDKIEGAHGYKISLYRAPRGAFDEPTWLSDFELPSTEFDLPADVSASLGVGEYTWEAWAHVNGLDQRLGRRNFKIVEDPTLRDTLVKTLKLPEPERSSAILRTLADHQFETDARAYARELPDSPERDAFLSAFRGR